MSASTIAIQQQVSQLLRLAELLAVEADQVPTTGAIEPAMLCRESVMAIGLLVLKLEATSQALREIEDAELLSRSVRLCEDCED